MSIPLGGKYVNTFGRGWVRVPTCRDSDLVNHGQGSPLIVRQGEAASYGLALSFERRPIAAHGLLTSFVPLCADSRSRNRKPNPDSSTPDASGLESVLIT